MRWLCLVHARTRSAGLSRRAYHLNGAEVKMPPAATTFKQAEKVKAEGGQMGMKM